MNTKSKKKSRKGIGKMLVKGVFVIILVLLFTGKRKCVYYDSGS